MKHIVFQVLLFIFPWRFRKWILKKVYKYQFAPSSRIGLSIILAKRLEMGDNASIGHLTLCKGIDHLHVGKNSGIGNLNFITGFSVESEVAKANGHFSHVENRKCELVIGEEVGVTSRHYFDCNGGIYIDDFVQIAGFGSCFMTHSIDLKENRQDAASIRIGRKSFIGSHTTVVKGAELPECCVVGAKSLLNKKFDRTYSLYAGVPCRFIKDISDYKFFSRKEGFVK